MQEREDTPDDLTVPKEVELGLAFGYGAAADPMPSVLDRLVELTGSRASVCLRDIDPDAPDPMLKPIAYEAKRSGRYTVQGVLGEGGVGTVHRGYDRDLGRDVAMKFLQERYRKQPDVLHRFVEEAQIGGQLQHPGIVPVYELGIADDRPFFAMKLVKGETLAERLARRARPEDGRAELLSVFESVCQTMAYAHARGVVHRDLKPANVMIGTFGEVQVVDWGMAKVLPRSRFASDRRADPKQEPSVIETVRTSDDSSGSVQGSVMGTPAYMPPEQARGAIEEMSERSDVFALGAILCEILTGEPPYVGPREEIVEMAKTARLEGAHERLAGCTADPTLVDLAARCLSDDPGARPASAEFVANAIHEYRAAVEQRAQDATVRAAALSRTRNLGIALAVVVAIGLAVSIGFWRDAERAASSERTARTQADESRAAAEANLANFNRLSYVVRLANAKDAESRLAPAWPEQAAAMRSWLDGEARELREAIPDLRRTLSSMARILSQASPADPGDPGHRKSADQFVHDTLRQLVADLESFTRVEIPRVESYEAWATRVAELTIHRHRDRWAKARRDIRRADGIVASELYAEVAIDLVPQMGLVPIGMNPRSKLWEFYHLRSAWDREKVADPADVPIPEHRPDGSLKLDGRGIVFVLIPGGKFSMGCQSEDRESANYDPLAHSFEGPVQEIELAPYFIARYEMTQGQWARMTDGGSPSHYRIGTRPVGNPVDVGETHPVEMVSWTTCDDLLRRHGLILPTEAQWERACRAGTTTPWFTGDTPTSLASFANIRDRTGQNAPPVWPGGEDFDDRFKGTSPVGTYAPNPFGLYDIHGNVIEWCRDRLDRYRNTKPNPGDGLREPGPHAQTRTGRGGSYHDPALLVRSACRFHYVPNVRSDHVGVRPARAVRGH